MSYTISHPDVPEGKEMMKSLRIDQVQPWVSADELEWGKLTEHERQAVVEDLMMQEEALSPLNEVGKV